MSIKCPVCKITELNRENTEEHYIFKEKVKICKYCHDQIHKGNIIFIPDWWVMSINQNVRLRVLERDNHTCQIYGRNYKKVKIELHYIIKKSNGGANYDENLICLCSRCHRLVHEAEKKKVYSGYGTAKYLKKLYKENDYKFIRALNNEIHDPSIRALKRLFEIINNEIDLNVNIVAGRILYINYCVV